MSTVRWMTAAAAAALVAAAGAVTAGAAEESAATTTATNAVKHQTVCPVMGGAVNKQLYVDFDGKRIYVCCSGCIDAVKKDAAATIRKMEADGIALDKVPPKEPGDGAGSERQNP